jgi:hypothetical protein
MHHRDMLDTDTVRTYAPPRTAAKYIAAMRRIAAARRTDRVRVFLSGPIAITSDRAKWEHRTAEVREQLPDGIELVSYADMFAQGMELPHDWETFAKDLDGLVLLPRRKAARHPCVYRTGPGARTELRTLVATRPTMIHAHERGLIPIIDCHTRRRGPNQDRLAITVPRRWDRNAETLRAALDALTPQAASGSAVDEAQFLHLAGPFAQPRRGGGGGARPPRRGPGGPPPPPPHPAERSGRRWKRCSRTSTSTSRPSA